MKYAELANAGVFDQPVYEPGKPIDLVAREHGLDPDSILKLASNENPFGPSPKAIEAVKKIALSLHLYPDGACTALRDRLAVRHGVDADWIVPGNGSNEIIELLGHVFLRPGVEVVMGSQAFIVYRLVAKLFGADVVDVPMKDYAHDLVGMAAAVTAKTRLVFLASPNNPTGPANDPAEIAQFARNLPEHVILVLDEAYAEYLEENVDVAGLVNEGCRIIGLRTFSKVFGLGGLRVGYGYGDPELISLLQRVRQPFNVNLVGQVAALAALDDDAFVERCLRANAAGRKQLVEGVQALGYEVVGGDANFVLIRVGEGFALFREMQAQGVIIRPLAAYGMPEFVRVTIGRPDENVRFLELLEKIRGVASARTEAGALR